MITLLCAAFGGAQVLFSTEVKFVDYVESTGSQAVDTGFFVTPQTRITADFAYTAKTVQQRVFGAAADTASPRYPAPSTSTGVRSSPGRCKTGKETGRRLA